MSILTTHSITDDLGGGRFRLQQHMKAINFRDDNGVMKPINSDWAASGDATKPHGVTAAPFSTLIAADAARAIYPTKETASHLDIGAPLYMPGVDWEKMPIGEAQRIKNEIVWVGKDYDLRVIHAGHYVKTEIELHGGYKIPGNKIAFQIGMTNDLTLTAAGSLNKGGAGKMLIKPSYAYDADDRNKQIELKHEFITFKGKNYIVIPIPAEVYGFKRPVIDPTLSLQPDATDGIDATIATGSGLDTGNNGVTTVLSHGFYTPNIWRFLLKFNLSSIVATATVTSATMSLWCQDGSVSNDTVNLYYCKQVWVEGTRNGVLDNPATGVTWERYDTTNNWQTAGCSGANDRDSTSMGSIARNITDALGDKKDVVLTTATVSAWVNGSIANNGMLGKGDTEAVTKSSGNFYSSDHATAGYRPKLDVVYALPVTASGRPRYIRL